MIPKEFIIDKFGGARRQIEVAIDLFFRQSDFVAIHTLSFSAFKILEDLANQRGINDSHKKSILDSCVDNAELQKSIHTIWNEAGNFLKHADNDPEKHIEFRPKRTAFILYDSCCLYRSLTAENNRPMGLYRTWFELKNKVRHNMDDAISKKIVELSEDIDPDDMFYWREEANKLGYAR